MKEFEEGDVVELNSGSPNLTVTGIEEDFGEKMVYFSWFAENTIHTGKSQDFSLKLVKEVSK